MRGNARCQNAGKHPFTSLAPHGLKNATTDLEVIRSWYTLRSWLNYGLTTDRLVVVDVDQRDGGQGNWETLEEEHGFQETWRVITGGGGEHVLYSAPTGVEITNNVGKLAPGIDVRARGGYIVGPGSLHATGARYLWRDACKEKASCHPSVMALAPCPSWLISKLVKTGGAAHGLYKPPRHWPAVVARDIGQGQRNSELASIAGKLFHLGADTALTTELLSCVNDARCQPPLEDMEIAKIVKSIEGLETARLEKVSERLKELLDA